MAKVSKSKTKQKSKSNHESPLTAQRETSVARSKDANDDDLLTGGSTMIRSLPKNNNNNNNVKQKHSHPDGSVRKQKSQKRARKEAQEDLEEEQLTKLLFGDGSSSEIDPTIGIGIQFGAAPMIDTRQKDSKERNTFAFEIDRTGDLDENSDEDHQVERRKRNDGVVRNELEPEWNDTGSDNGDDDEAPAWEDPDDSTIKLLDASYRVRKLRRSREETAALSSHEFEKRLRERYEETAQGAARTDWATNAANQKQAQEVDKEDQDDEDEFTNPTFNVSKSLLSTSRNRLPPNILNILRCPDANITDPNKAVVRAVNFHPGSDPDQPLLLTAGLDKNLRFFQVREEKSEKIHGIQFPKMPIYSASFLGNTGKVVLSGRRNFFYFYDAVSGKVDLVPRILGRDERSWERHAVSPDGQVVAFVGNDGYVVLVDTHSKQWIGNLKLNGSVRAITFTPDGSNILASGSDGDIYRWDVKSRQCLERFSNGDGTITSSLSASSTNLAVGAESGVVNLYSEYDRRGITFGTPGNSKTPVKSIMNLHTSADLVMFNHDGKILAMSTQREKNNVKLVHVSSKTVFSNWPTSKTPLGYVWSMDFSPSSKFLAIGNDKGNCLLYKLQHYHTT